MVTGKNFDEGCMLNINGTVGYFPKEFIEEAVSKRIKIKPNKRHSKQYGDSYNDGECPSCGASYSDSLSETPLFCSQCGQAFDWSDDE